MIHSRFFLTPSTKKNDALLGILGRALELYPDAKLIGYHFLSNHLTLLLWVPDVFVQASFVGHLKSNIAREIGRLVAWKEKFWGRPFRSILVLGADAEVNRFKYLLSQGCKEGLVARPQDWPGVSCVNALLTGVLDEGTWHDRTSRYRADRLRRKDLSDDEFSTRYKVRIDPLPCWAHLTAEEYRAKVRELVTEIELETAAINAAKGRSPMGEKKILEKDPLSRPKQTAKSPAPPVHASDRATRDRFLDLYGAFLDACSAAAERLRRGVTAAIEEFPDGAFVPRLPLRPRLSVC